MPRPHLVCAAGPLPEFHEYRALCGKPIVRAHWLGFYELESGSKPTLNSLRGICAKCLQAEPPQFGWIYKAIEDSQTKGKRGIATE